MTGTTPTISGLHQIDPVNKADLASPRRRERAFIMRLGFSPFEQVYSLPSISDFSYYLYGFSTSSSGSCITSTFCAADDDLENHGFTATTNDTPWRFTE